MEWKWPTAVNVWWGQGSQRLADGRGAWGIQLGATGVQQAQHVQVACGGGRPHPPAPQGYADVHRHTGTAVHLVIPSHPTTSSAHAAHQDRGRNRGEADPPPEKNITPAGMAIPQKTRTKRGEVSDRRNQGRPQFLSGPSQCREAKCAPPPLRTNPGAAAAAPQPGPAPGGGGMAITIAVAPSKRQSSSGACANTAPGGPSCGWGRRTHPQGCRPTWRGESPGAHIGPEIHSETPWGRFRPSAISRVGGWFGDAEPPHPNTPKGGGSP